MPSTVVLATEGRGVDDVGAARVRKGTRVRRKAVVEGCMVGGM